MPRPKKIKSPEDFGKEFEKLKKPRKKVDEKLKKYDNQMGKTDLSDLPETKFEKATKEAIKEGTALEELQELEKKLRACTDETPRDIRYKIECNRFILVLQYNSIEVRGDVFYPEMLKGIYIDFRKSELSTAQKMHEVLKEWSKQ